MPNSALPGNFAKGETGATGPPGAAGYISPAFIDGLQMRRVDGSSVAIGSGACAIAGTVYENTAEVTLTSGSGGQPTLTGSQLYYIYATGSGSTLSFIFDTTAPESTPFRGTARYKTGVTTHRLIGAFRVQSGNVLAFQSRACGSEYTIEYLGNHYDSPQRALSGGTATSYTNIDISGLAPLGCHAATIYGDDNSGTVGNDSESLIFTNSLASGRIWTVNAGFTATHPAMPLDGSRVFQYRFNGTAPGGGANVDVLAALCLR